MMMDLDDEIVSETPVFLKHLKDADSIGELLLLQFPSRPKIRPFEKINLAAIRPKKKQIQLEIESKPENNNYFGIEEDDQTARQILVSAPAVPPGSLLASYCLAVENDNNITLIPVSATCQMKPFYPENNNNSNVTLDVNLLEKQLSSPEISTTTTTTTGPVTLGPRAQHRKELSKIFSENRTIFVDNSFSEETSLSDALAGSQKDQQQPSQQQQQQQQHGDSWTKMKIVESSQLPILNDNIINNNNNSRKLDFVKISQEQYLTAICHANNSNDDNSGFKSEIALLPVRGQLEAIMKKICVGSFFADIYLLLSPTTRFDVKIEEILAELEKVAVVVLGNFVVASDFVAGTCKNERLLNARDFCLLMLERGKKLLMNDLQRVLALSKEEVVLILRSLCNPGKEADGSISWTFKLKTDDDFMKKFPTVLASQKKKHEERLMRIKSAKEAKA